MKLKSYALSLKILLQEQKYLVNVNNILLKPLSIKTFNALKKNYKVISNYYRPTLKECPSSSLPCDNM